MQEMTLYLPDDLRLALQRAAARRKCSMAEVVRDALRAFPVAIEPPKPRLPLFSSRNPRLAADADDALAGFGER